MTTVLSLFLLAAATIFPCLMIVVRFLVTGSVGYLFIWWNLFLAWIPLLLAWVVVQSQRKAGWRLVAAVAWLLFLPNAPYLVTDLIHFRHSGPLLSWYDLTLLVTAAGSGLLLGFLSLRMMQTFVAGYLGSIISWLFSLGVLGLCSVGVYLGRFLRWNSWEVLTRPGTLLEDLGPLVKTPLAHLDAYAFVLFFGAMLMLLYAASSAAIWLARAGADKSEAVMSQTEMVPQPIRPAPAVPRPREVLGDARAASSRGRWDRRAGQRGAA